MIHENLILIIIYFSKYQKFTFIGFDDGINIVFI